MKRCSPCNKSRHYQCQAASCECKCRIYSDIKGREEPDRLSDPANDDFAEEINRQFNELRT